MGSLTLSIASAEAQRARRRVAGGSNSSEIAGAIGVRGWCLVRMPMRDVHELALMESVVDAVVEQIGDRRVAVVRLEIGALAGVAVDAMRFSFDVCARGTPLEGASLDIVEIRGVAQCRQCGSREAMTSYGASCSCGSFERELVSGDELRLKEVEVI